MNFDQMFARTPIPSRAEMQSRLDNMWERLQSEIENTTAEHISISVSIRPYWVFGKAPWVVAGVVAAAILVSALVWRHEPSFSTTDDHTMAKSSSQRGADPLQITVPGDAFEVASVKLVPASSEAGKVASMGETSQMAIIGCPGGYAYTTRVDPGRLTIPGASVLSLVMLAYGRDCTLVSGGPAWTRSGEYYEIQTLLPKDTPATETMGALLKGEAPRLQGMLQNLLAHRFHLVLKRELREIPVYALTVEKAGKMKVSPEETLPLPAGFPELPGTLAVAGLRRGQLMRMPAVQIAAHAISMADLAKEIRKDAGRVVVDKTGLTDVFDVYLKYAPNAATSTTAAPPVPPQSVPPLPGAPAQSSLQDALRDQLGLKLESVEMPLEVLVIEGVERPSVN